MLSGEAVHSWRVAVEIQLMFFNATIGSKNYITAADETHPSLLDNLLYFSPSLPSLAFDGTLSPSFVRFCDTYISSDNNNRPRTERVYNFVEICIAHGTCVGRTARQKHELALYIFIYLDFRLVVAVTPSIVLSSPSNTTSSGFTFSLFIRPCENILVQMKENRKW